MLMTNRQSESGGWGWRTNSSGGRGRVRRLQAAGRFPRLYPDRKAAMMPIMPDIRNIDTQRAIADAYIANGGNGEKAVTAAGYAEKYARSHAYRLIARPEVRQMIRERGDAIAGQRLAGMEDINAFWTAVMRDEGRDIKGRLKASELRAKAAGGFLDKVSLTGPAPVVICGGDDLR